jgi:predicted DCC family thiol-disulfide oxidoreductase YuxK
MMVYDGDCGFCRYWLVKWKKLSRDHYEYQPFQSVAENFKDIPFRSFQKEVHLIFSDGTVLKGAAVAFYPYYQFRSAAFLYDWYQKSKIFKRISDLAYQWVARNRDLSFRLSKLLFGKDPYKNGLIALLLRILMLAIITLTVLYLANILPQ